MQTVEELHAAFQGLVQAASGVQTVILANQGAPAPTGLYATYNPVPIRAIGAPRRVRVDVDAEDTDLEYWTDFDETVITQMDFMLSLNFLNEGAKNAAMRMHNANYRIPIQEYLYTYRIGWRQCSNIRDFTAIFQADPQPRYQVDVDLYIESEITDRILRAAGFQFEITDEDNIL